MSSQVSPSRLPSYRHHKPSGQAVVTLSGRDFYLGRYGTQASRAEYNQLVGKWLAGGRCLPPGQSDAGWCRGVVNQRTSRIKRIFKWAVAEELVPPSVHHGLSAVDGLPKGRSGVRESVPVQPVADAVVDATLPHLPEIVADMVRLQRLTGCWPGEVCILRPMDVDTSAEVWIYRPESHKTEHHGRERVICIGPKGQDVLRPYLLRPAECHCFVPAESERRRLALRHELRKTPLSCGNRPGTNRKPAVRGSDQRPTRSHFPSHLQ